MSWHDIHFGEFVTLQRGFDLPKSKMQDGNIPVIGSNCIIGFHNETKLEAPGVVTGRSGTLGLVQYTDVPYWPHNTALWVKDFKENNPRFVFYKLQTLHLERFNGGVSVPTLNRNVLDRLPVRIPEQKEQRRIASILSAYDDLIENNRRRIQLLEQAAREMYKEWFVRLRFPGHKHIKIKDGIPEGWEKKQLEDVVGTQYGFTETAADEPIGPKFLRGKDINKTSYIDWSSVPFCPEDKLNFGKYALHVDDIIVIRMADPGKVGIVETEQRAVFASYLVRLKRKAGVKIPALYLFYILSGDLYQGFISGASSGSTRKSANAKLLVDFNILIPPHELLAMLIDQIQPVRKQMQTLLQQNANLKQARDLLLPRLVSGDTEFHVKYEQPKETDRVYK